MLPYRWIMTEGIDHWSPARSRFLQTVNENHRRPGRIERLKPTKHCCVRVSSWIQDTRQPKPFRAFTRNQKCRGRIEISGKRKNVFVQCNSFGIQRIDELEARFPTGKANDRSNGRVDAA